MVKRKISIAGNGIVALMIAYFSYLEARENKDTLRVTVRGRHGVDKTTGAFLFPSLSWGELLAVVPPSKKLLADMEKPFNEFMGGIKVDSPLGTMESAKAFIEAVESIGDDTAAQERRTLLLADLGQYSVLLWEYIYHTADEKLKGIMEECNYLPCREPHEPESLKLRDGYRIDLFFDAVDLENTIDKCLTAHKNKGYRHAQILTPDELETLDPKLSEFCNRYSEEQAANGKITRAWKEGAAALFQPGGCINTAKFLPRFAQYLQEVMGSYIHPRGEKKNFRMKLGTVTGLQYDPNQHHVEQFSIDGRSRTQKRHYDDNLFILCPGESVGTVQSLGITEPPAARFVGASIKLKMPLAVAESHGFANYTMNMLLQTGVAGTVTQAGLDDSGHFFIGIAGLKAFYGTIEPKAEHQYALDANVYQLNMLNSAFPRIVSLCLGEDTFGKKLTREDLVRFETAQLVDRGVGSRAAAFDGAPTIDAGYNAEGKVDNLYIATHLSSGGVTNAPGAAALFLALKAKNTSATTPFSQKLRNSLFNPYARQTLAEEDAILEVTQSTRY